MNYIPGDAYIEALNSDCEDLPVCKYGSHPGRPALLEAFLPKTLYPPNCETVDPDLQIYDILVFSGF